MSARDDFIQLISEQLYGQIYQGPLYKSLNPLYHNDKAEADILNTRYLRAKERVVYWTAQYDINPTDAVNNFNSSLGSASVDPATAVKWPPTEGLFSQPLQANWSQASSSAMDYIKNKPSIPASQIQSDWAQAGTGAVDFIKNKPSIPSAQIQSDWTQASTGALDYVKNKPSIPAAQIQSDWNQASTGALDYIKNKPAAPAARSQSSASRSLNSGFQVSSTRDALVNYSVDILTSITLTTGQAGTVFLEIASDSGFSSPQELARFVNGNTGTLTLGLSLSQNVTGTLSGYIPVGYYARLRTANTTGSPTFNYRSGQEVLL